MAGGQVKPVISFVIYSNNKNNNDNNNNDDDDKNDNIALKGFQLQILRRGWSVHVNLGPFGFKIFVGSPFLCRRPRHETVSITAGVRNNGCLYLI